MAAPMPAASWVAWDLVAATLVAEIVAAARLEAACTDAASFVTIEVHGRRFDYANAAGRALAALARSCSNGAAVVGARWTEELERAARVAASSQADRNAATVGDDGLVLAKLVVSRPTEHAARLGLDTSPASRIALMASARVGAAAAAVGNVAVLKMVAAALDAPAPVLPNHLYHARGGWAITASSLVLKRADLVDMAAASAAKSCQAEAFRWCIREALALDDAAASQQRRAFYSEHRVWSLCHLEHVAMTAARHDGSARLLAEVHRLLLERESAGSGTPGATGATIDIESWRACALAVAVEARQVECVRFLLGEEGKTYSSNALENALISVCRHGDTVLVREVLAAVVVPAEPGPGFGYGSDRVGFLLQGDESCVRMAIAEDRDQVVALLLPHALAMPDPRDDIVRWLRFAIWYGRYRSAHLLMAALAHEDAQTAIDAVARVASSTDIGNFATAATRAIVARMLQTPNATTVLWTTLVRIVYSATPAPGSGPAWDLAASFAEALPTLLTTTEAAKWLYDAISGGTAALVEWLLAHGGADANYLGPPDCWPSWSSQFDMEGSSLRTSWPAPLGMAAMKGKRTIVQVLLRHGADVHFNDDEAVRLASLLAPTDLVQDLIEACADVTTVNNQALRSAAKKLNAPTVLLLLKHGADVHAGNELVLRTAIQQTFSDSSRRALVSMALEYGADVHVDNDWPVRTAAEQLDLEMVRILVAHGADVTAKKNEAVRRVAMATKTRTSPDAQARMLQFLVEHGADAALAQARPPPAKRQKV